MTIAIWAAVIATVSAPAEAAPIGPEHPVPVLSQWTCPATPEANLTYYPDEAMDKGVQGLADVDCKISPAGSVTSCILNEETPPGWGFGEKGLHLACFFKFKPAKHSETPREMKHKIIRFQLGK